jgi:DNA modification methylase
MPLALAERCVLAGCRPGGVVLDPFSGAGTTGLAATELGRRYIGIDLNEQYLELSLRTRLKQGVLDLEVGA